MGQHPRYRERCEDERKHHPSAPPMKAKHQQSSVGPAERKLEVPGKSQEAWRLKPQDTETNNRGLMPGTYNLKSQLRSEQAGSREEALQVHSARAPLRRRYLQPQGGPPPSSGAPGRHSRAGLRSSHSTRVKRSLGRPFKCSELVLALCEASAASAQGPTELVFRGTGSNNGLRESAASCSST